MAPVEQPLDLLVIGSGVAGLSAAVLAADLGLAVGVVTKGQLEQTTTRWAQGGVAAVLSGDPDSTDLHLADTLAAGVGLCDEKAVRVLVDEGPGRVLDLIARGAVFDRDETGKLLLAQEGGHSTARVVHAGGAATGVEIERALVAAVKATATELRENHFVTDLVVEDGRCVGVQVLDQHGENHQVRAPQVLLAAGGAGQLFAVTTNPLEATGDGVSMALRAGVAVADVEFVQFHPTALHHDRMPRPLLSEALRGHGALLRDRDGESFVDELAPRDVVSRAMTQRMFDQEAEHLWLDATGLASFSTRFPTIAADLEKLGLDPAKDWLPVAPAAHYLCGGVVTDLQGASSLPGLWAAGEVACVGVHGANRLASNSLLDGMVYGARVVEAVAAGKDGPEATGPLAALLTPQETPRPGVKKLSVCFPAMTGSDDPQGLRKELQQTMTRYAGVVRNENSLTEAATRINALAVRCPKATDSPAAAETANLITLATALVAAALTRQESRGAHTRQDFLATDPAFALRLVVNA